MGDFCHKRQAQRLAMPRKKPVLKARHPRDAMEKFERLLKQMAPKVEPVSPPTLTLPRLKRGAPRKKVSKS